jgi:hypothetical protein
MIKEKTIEKTDLHKLVIDDSIEPVRIHVHPSLEDEFKFWREEFEKIAGYEIAGGKPIISKICAHLLKQLRTKKSREEKRIIIEIHKIVGLKKSKITFL